MRNNFRIKFDAIEKSRRDLYGRLDHLNENEIIFKLAPNKWSITQIIFHLVKSEQLTFIGFSRNVEKRENLKNSGIAGYARYIALSIALKSHFKFKAPALVSNMPEKYDIQELKNKWNTIRSNFGKTLEEFPETLENKEIFKHPIAGWLNAGQMLDFLNDHFDHHNRQIQNLIDIQRQN